MERVDSREMGDWDSDQRGALRTSRAVSVRIRLRRSSVRSSARTSLLVARRTARRTKRRFLFRVVIYGIYPEG